MQNETTKIVNEIIGSVNDPYRKIDLQWREWFSQRDEIMEGLSSKWYIRRFVPRRKSANEINLDDPFPPQGDMVIFLSIGRSRQNELAENIAGQIEKYSESNCSSYEPVLRIRSVIFHTADEYVAELEEKLTTEITNLINIPERKEDEINKQWGLVKKLKDEMDSVVASVNREIFQEREITDADILNKWEDLCDICKNGIEKVNDISPKYENTEAHQLVKAKGVLL